jgi:hypothetical protein
MARESLKAVSVLALKQLRNSVQGTEGGLLFEWLPAKSCSTDVDVF